MTAWVSRNATPILFVLVASALVIGAFEIIDAISGSTPASSVAAVEPEIAADDLDGAAALAGLIKAMAFLLVGGGVTLLVRRAQKP